MNQGNQLIKPNFPLKLFGYTRKELIFCEHRCLHAPLGFHFPPVYFTFPACPPLLPEAEQLVS